MEIRVQSLDDVEQNVKIYVNRKARDNSHATLHGIFSYLRSMDKYTFIGDYPLLHSTLVALKNIGMVVKRSTVASCINRRCKDLKGKFPGKKDILEQLYQTL